MANEYTQVSVNSQNQIPGGQVMYDPRGNLTRDDGFDGDNDDGFAYTYDVDNRVIAVEYDDGTNPLVAQAEYRYDALGRRIEYIDHTRDITIRYFYDGQNVIEEHEGENRRAYFNGSQYIDERAVMRSYESGGAQDHYYLLEELYTVAGLAKCNGQLEEMVVYDTYGHARVRAWPRSDVNRDGAVNIFDQIAVRDAGSTQNPLYDVVVDGWVNIFDQIQARNDLDQVAVEVTYSSLDNPFLFTGRLTDTLHADDLLVSEDDDFKRIQDNRNRMYDTKHGRWLQRDPLNYLAGLNLYEYVRSKAVTDLDPRGEAPRTRADGTPYWEYLPNMGKLDVNFGPLNKDGAEPFAFGSSMIIRFINNVEAFRTRGCCAEVRFMQIHKSSVKYTDPIRNTADLLLGFPDDWIIDDGRIFGRWAVGWNLEGYYPAEFTRDPRLVSPCSQMNDAAGLMTKEISATQDYETCAVCSKPLSCRKGEVYGCIKWGHSFYSRQIGPTVTGVTYSWVQWNRYVEPLSWGDSQRTVYRTVLVPETNIVREYAAGGVPDPQDDPGYYDVVPGGAPSKRMESLLDWWYHLMLP